MSWWRSAEQSRSNGRASHACARRARGRPASAPRVAGPRRRSARITVCPRDDRSGEHPVAAAAEAAVSRIARVEREVAGLGEPFGVRVVGAEQDALLADQPGERNDVLLVIRRHEHVATEDVAGPLADPASEPRAVATHAVHLVHHLQQVRHPQRAVLDADAADVGEPAEQVVEDQRGERVHDRAIAVEARPLERRLAVRRRVRLLTPRDAVQLVVARTRRCGSTPGSAPR